MHEVYIQPDERGARGPPGGHARHDAHVPRQLPLLLGGRGQLRVRRRAAAERPRRRRLLHGVRRRPLGRVRAAPLPAEGQARRARSGHDEARRARAEGRAEATHRGGEPVRRSRPAVPVAAVRLLVHRRGQRADGGRAAREARAGGRDGARGLGLPDAPRRGAWTMGRSTASSAPPARATATTPAACSSPFATAGSGTSAAIPTTPSRAGSCAASARSATTARGSIRSSASCTRCAAPGPKGSGEFERISWDEALAECAERLGGVIAEHGGAAILNVHYSGTLGLVGYTFPMRLLGAMGTTEVTPDTICNLAGHVALGYLYGTSETGLRPAHARRRALHPGVGREPVGVRPAPGRALARRGAGHRRRRRPDPDADRGARRHPPAAAPGQRCRARVRADARDRARRPVDRDYIARTRPGSTSSSRCSPTARPSGRRRRPACRPPTSSASRGSTAPGRRCSGSARACSGSRPAATSFRACASLPAITGNFAQAGRRASVHERGDRVGRRLRRRWCPSTSLAGAADLAHGPGRRAGRPGPLARAGLLEHEHRRVRAAAARDPAPALARDDLFTLVVDPFPTDTARYADIVLPAATFLEHDDVVVPYFDLGLAAQVKAVDPPGEAMPNSEIFRRLAAAMGYDDPALYEPDEAIMERLVAGSDLVPDLAELRAARHASTRRAAVRPVRRRRVRHAQRPHRDRQRRRRGRRPPARPRPARRRAAGRRPAAPALPRLAVDDERVVLQRPQGPRPARRDRRSRAPKRGGQARPRRRATACG